MVLSGLCLPLHSRFFICSLTITKKGQRIAQSFAKIHVNVSVYVCKCVCVYVGVCACVTVCVFVCVWMRTNVCASVYSVHVTVYVMYIFRLHYYSESEHVSLYTKSQNCNQIIKHQVETSFV